METPHLSPPPPPSRTRSCFTGCLLSLGLLCLAIIGGSIALAILVTHFTDHFDHSLSTDPSKNYVACITIKGTITLEDDARWFATPDSPAAALQTIEEAIKDPAVKAIFLKIDSPGGGITASDIIYEALQRFKKSSPERRIVALLGDTAASGGYYIALPADLIIAHPTTITGSIGVIMQSYNFQQLAKMIGIDPVVIKSGDNKDLLSPFREMTPQQRELLQGIIDTLQNRFVALTAENRRLSEETVRPLADGRIYLADQALAHGLIDAIGYEADAKEKIRTLINDPDPIFLDSTTPTTFFDRLLLSPGLNLNLNLTLPALDRQARLGYEHQW